MSAIQTIQMQSNSGGVRTSTTALPNHEREFGFIQNVGTNPLFVKFGDGCTTSDFDLILAGGVSDNDGSGSAMPFNEDGIITISGISPKYTAFER